MTPEEKAANVALLAEKVMGWHVGAGLPSGYFNEQKEFVRWAVRWDPYTNIADTMEMLEKARQSGEWCCLTLVSDYHYTWNVNLTRSELRGNDEHKPTIRSGAFEGGLDALRAAICAACLEWARAQELGVKL